MVKIREIIEDSSRGLLFIFLSNLVAFTAASAPFELSNSSIADTMMLHVGNDHTQVSEDVNVRIPVLRNDYDPVSLLDTQSLRVIDEYSPQYGHVQIDSTNGHIVYSPDANFHGLDSFRYEVCNLEGWCSFGWVFVQVHPINDIPVAIEDSVSVAEDDTIMIWPLLNDLDSADGEIQENEHRLEVVHLPYRGDLVVNDWQSIQYSPKANYFGKDFFKYSICDHADACATAMVRITVVPRNDLPWVLDDTDTTYQGLLSVVDILSNDTDSLDEIPLDMKTLEVDPQSAAGASTHLDTSTNMVIYVPDPSFMGVDSFSYRICDQGPDPIYCLEAKVTVMVLPRPQVSNMTPAAAVESWRHLNLNEVERMKEMDLWAKPLQFFDH